MKAKLTLMIAALLVFMSIGLASCSDKIDYYDNEETASGNPAPGFETDTPPEPMEPTGPFLSIDDEHSSYEPNSKLIRVEYIGMIDTNSVEVYDFENDIMLAARLDDESKVMLEKSNLESGDIVSAEYYIDANDRIVLISLEKEIPNNLESSVEFLGQIDSNSIEVRDAENKKVDVYRLSYKLMSRFADFGFNEGDAIIISYYKDVNGSNIISNLKPDSQGKRTNVIYKGQIDANSIEVCIPETNELKALRLGDILKQNFSEYGLIEDQTITIEYIVDENLNCVVTQILD
jgi:hypothetical protein